MQALFTSKHTQLVLSVVLKYLIALTCGTQEDFEFEAKDIESERYLFLHISILSFSIRVVFGG